jgi:hypothetical protein
MLKQPVAAARLLALSSMAHVKTVFKYLLICPVGHLLPEGTLLNKSEMTLPSRDREGASHESDKRWCITVQHFNHYKAI